MDTTSVLFVCTTATARSPIADSLFKRNCLDLGVQDYLKSSFAGSYSGIQERGPDYRMIKVASNLGLDLKLAKSVALEKKDLKANDHIFAMDLASYEYVQFLDKTLVAPKIRLFFECSSRADLREVPDPVTGAISFVECAKLIEVGVQAIVNFLIHERALK